MLLKHLGHTDAAIDIEKAVLSVLAEGEILTPDLGGSSSTSSVGDAIVGSLGK